MEKESLTEKIWVLQNFSIPNQLILKDFIKALITLHFTIWMFASWDEGKEMSSVYVKENYLMLLYIYLFIYFWHFIWSLEIPEDFLFIHGDHTISIQTSLKNINLKKILVTCFVLFSVLTLQQRTSQTTLFWARCWIRNVLRSLLNWIVLGFYEP